jgi:hypothetical protein
MILAVILIVGVLILVTMGYSLGRDGRIEQTGLVQFESHPSGATVLIDGEAQFAKTTTKAVLSPGEHQFEVRRDGYDSWQKKANISSGRVLWLNYTRLLPNKRADKFVKYYEGLYKMSVSPQSRYALMLDSPPSLTLHYLDMRGDDVESQSLQISKFFAELDVEGVQHSFDVISWNNDENRVLVKHDFGGNSEWVWLNLKDISSSLNLTNEYRLGITDVKFAANDGKKLVLLEGGNLRRADVGNKTISAVLADKVLKVYMASEKDVLLITDDQKNKTRSFGFYKNGDQGLSEIYALEAKDGDLLNVVGGKYYGDEYVAISENNKLQVLKGDFPTFGRVTDSLRYLVDVKLDWPIERLELSANKRFVHAINKGKVYSYDLENLVGQYFTLDGKYDSSEPLNWLDDYMLWTDKGGQLVIYDFDGDNKRQVQKVEPGFKVLLSDNSKWLYSVSKTASGRDLRRFKMIAD